MGESHIFKERWRAWILGYSKFQRCSSSKAKLENSYLLANILLGKYCHSSFFLEVAPPNSAFHEWRGVLIGRDLLLSNLGKTIGNGLNTKVWSELWISLLKPTMPFGPATEHTSELVVADLLERHEGVEKRYGLQSLSGVSKRHIIPETKSARSRR